MFKRIHSNRDPNDTLFSEIKKEFGGYFGKAENCSKNFLQQHTRLVFKLMVCALVLSIMLSLTVFRKHEPPVNSFISKKAPQAKSIAQPAVLNDGFSRIIQVGSALREMIALKKQVDSITSKKTYRRRTASCWNRIWTACNKLTHQTKDQMAINLKQPKYVLPLVALPFLCLFFYVYHSSTAKNQKQVKQQVGINTSVGDVSPNIKKKNLADKLDAYRSTYKNADGYTAVNPIPSEQAKGAGFNNSYSDKEKRMLDSINEEMKRRYGTPAGKAIAQRPPATVMPSVNRSVTANTTQDKALQDALAGLANRQRETSAPRQNSASPQKDKDPMEIFKQQMAYMDSINKSNDPAYKAEKLKQQALAKANAERNKEALLEVRKAALPPDDFNTVMPENKEAFIMAIIDENVTGYAGSRIRLRLLEDITAGKILIKKGTYLYALINGFSGQRVTLQIKSILYNDKELPVKLDVYDMDGLPGLYVPESQFRDFTKDLGANTIQGVSIDGNAQNGSQLLMSSADKIFQSTSTAIASAIRKNKAKIKYNSYIYLIDIKAQEKAQ